MRDAVVVSHQQVGNALNIFKRLQVPGAVPQTQGHHSRALSLGTNHEPRAKPSELGEKQAILVAMLQQQRV